MADLHELLQRALREDPDSLAGQIARAMTREGRTSQEHLETEQVDREIVHIVRVAMSDCESVGFDLDMTRLNAWIYRLVLAIRHEARRDDAEQHETLWTDIMSRLEDAIYPRTLAVSRQSLNDDLTRAHDAMIGGRVRAAARRLNVDPVAVLAMFERAAARMAADQDMRDLWQGAETVAIEGRPLLDRLPPEQDRDRALERAREGLARIERDNSRPAARPDNIGFHNANMRRKRRGK